MASIRDRIQTDGSVKYAVLFRQRATRKQTSLTYASRVEAEQMAAVIEANGGDLRSAQRVMAASERSSPLAREVVLEHISMLTAVAPGQLVRYRNQLRDHLSGPIGVTPVDSLDIRVIISWIHEMQGIRFLAQLWWVTDVAEMKVAAAERDCSTLSARKSVYGTHHPFDPAIPIAAANRLSLGIGQSSFSARSSRVSP